MKTLLLGMTDVKAALSMEGVMEAVEEGYLAYHRGKVRQPLKEGILLNPGSIYDFKKSNTLRLSYAYVDEEKIMGSLEKLAVIVRKMQR